MKPRSLALLVALIIAGCASPSARHPIAGYYTSPPVQLDTTGSAITEELILILSPDGTFVTWFQMYSSDGRPILFSGLAAYDLQRNAHGTWRFADGRLFLRGTGPSYVVTEWQMKAAGASSPALEDTAAAVYRNGRWVVNWGRTEYQFKKDVPNHAAEATPGNRPAALPGSGFGAPHQ